MVERVVNCSLLHEEKSPSKIRAAFQMKITLRHGNFVGLSRSKKNIVCIVKMIGPGQLRSSC